MYCTILMVVIFFYYKDLQCHLNSKTVVTNAFRQYFTPHWLCARMVYMLVKATERKDTKFEKILYSLNNFLRMFSTYKQLIVYFYEF